MRSNHHTHASPAPITMPGLTDRHHANRVIAMGEIRTFGLPVQRHALITMQPCSTLGLMDAQRSRMVSDARLRDLLPLLARSPL